MISSVQVYLVDTSGSMDGINKDDVCKTVENEQIDYLFAFGNTIRGQVDPKQLRGYPFNTGTAIQYCLFEMFSKLKTIKGDKKHLLLVTDAEDAINDVEGLKRSWSECQEHHKKNGGYLAGNALFIGSGTQGCRKEIEAVFGSVLSTAPGQVAGVLKRIQDAIKTAEKCDQELVGIEMTIKQLDMKSAQVENVLSASETKVSDLKESVELAQKETENIKSEVLNLQNGLQSIKDTYQRDMLGKQLKKAKASSAQLEAMQETFLSQSESVLSKIGLKKIEVEKQKSEVTAQQQSVNGAIGTTTQGMTELENMQDKLKDLRSQLQVGNDDDNNSIEKILEQILKVSSDVREQARKQNKNLSAVFKIQKNLTGLKQQLGNSEVSLDESKKAINDQLDQFFQMAV